MSAIGSVTRKKNGNFEGFVRTLTIDAPLTLVPVSKTSERAPDYRILSNCAEVGAAWIRTAQTSGNTYIALMIDTPELARRIHANLGPTVGQDDPNTFTIFWNRPGTKS